MIDARPLARRSAELLAHQAQALDGLLDVGFYGAVAKAGRPDVTVSRERAAEGLLSLIDTHRAARHWLVHELLAATTRESRVTRGHEGTCEQARSARARDLAVIAASCGLVIATALWPTLVEDAARDGILLEVVDRQEDRPQADDTPTAADGEPGTRVIETTDGLHVGLVGAEHFTPEELARVLAPQSYAELAATLDDIMSKRAGLVAESESPESPEPPSDGAMPPLRLGDGAWRAALAAAAPVMEAVGPLLRGAVGRGFHGAPPPEGLAAADAHLHALVEPEAGLVTVHAHNEHGARFIVDVLLDPEPFAFGRATPNSEDQIGSDVLVGLTTWPAILELARGTGTVVYCGDPDACAESDGA